ncbi:TPA: hypothetical protein DDW69_02810 [candidate division CPR2 bacterium]|uniref:Type IV pilus assembly protein PilM n=1 Tax=candidate division CPR2 bacterium GW2011_GWC1_41_48 TaxID=1618344 RepID=A0A0G0W872_UNCC2|nr:MAG: type IV pilus assembly protein PilM [candidate division CPR2 bacterium GW2011_GWC2_39_35]KKR29291.1 MAG: type IV pilus assembly protein PilM [candidate division CPR2 bacterium GW2011_GWD2_39_7]KKR29651.1 MAG: type IV pilus assembly protein PilM [candidate division CPR2 bacterium GW2011_GWD1_39_7]KKS09175.1 MAG: type IV pilus assembly protein PilM [candidate division CPR2 bacterium GW2011_GWC1_41_48]OGB56938.1 MAG: hypothetical protein A2Y27_02355 [candidate division CPR2 bacterium GWD1_
MNDYFGLDIGNSSIKIVQVALKKPKPFLVALSEFNIPFGLAESDSDADRKKLVGLIQQAISQTQLKTRNVVSTISSNKISSDIFQFPYMTNEELKFAMKYELKYHIPDLKDDQVCDWHVLGRDIHGNLDIFVAAVSRHISNKYSLVMKEAGLNPLAFDAESLALAKILGEPQKNIVVIHGGAQYTLLLVLINGNLKMEHVVQTGGVVVTNNIAGSLNITKENAELLKRKFGLEKSKLDGHIYNAIVRSLDPIVKELRSVMESQQFKAQDFEEVVLSGGVALTPQITDYLSQILLKKVVLANPWKKIDCGDRPGEVIIPAAPKFSLAAGLALSHYVI